MTMRPLGPEPLSCDKSRFLAAARRRASGLAAMRPEALATLAAGTVMVAVAGAA